MNNMPSKDRGFYFQLTPSASATYPRRNIDNKSHIDLRVYFLLIIWTFTIYNKEYQQWEIVLPSNSFNFQYIFQRQYRQQTLYGSDSISLNFLPMLIHIRKGVWTTSLLWISVFNSQHAFECRSAAWDDWPSNEVFGYWDWQTKYIYMEYNNNFAQQTEFFGKV